MGDGIVEFTKDWRAAMSAALIGDEAEGEPFLAKVGAGIAAVAPFIAKAAQTLGDAFIESMADDIMGKASPPSAIDQIQSGISSGRGGTASGHRLKIGNNVGRRDRLDACRLGG